MLDIRIDETDFDRAMQQLKGIPWAIQKAFVPAVSEVMDHIRSGLVQYLVSEVPLPDKALRKAVQIGQVRKSGETVSGSILVQSKAQPLIHYEVEPEEITARPGKSPHQWPDFTFSLRTGERREGKSRVAGGGFPFIAVMPGGHMGVYFRPGYRSRENENNYAVKQAYGPSIQYHVVTPRVLGMFEEEVESRMPVTLTRHVQQTLAAEAR